MKSVGIDGCKAGWVTACYEDEEILLFKTIEEVVKHYGNGYELLIDIPIGLASEDCKIRNCEKEARAALQGTRKSSVFSVPCREALHARSYTEKKHLEDYSKTNEVNKNILGKGLSVQSYSIMPKIKEVDDFLILNPEIRQRLKESHPEIAFQFLNYKELNYNKKSKEGIKERLEILTRLKKQSETLYHKAVANYLRKQVAKDDILDALCLTLTKHLVLTQPDNYTMASFPSDPLHDEEGIEMAIYYGSPQTK